MKKEYFVGRENEPVEFMYFPFIGHSPTLPHHYIEIMEQNNKWFKKLQIQNIIDFED